MADKLGPLDLEPRAFRIAKENATEIKPVEAGGSYPLWDVPHHATVAAITTYLTEMGMEEAHEIAKAERAL